MEVAGFFGCVHDVPQQQIVRGRKALLLLMQVAPNAK